MGFLDKMANMLTCLCSC